MTIPASEQEKIMNGVALLPWLKNATAYEDIHPVRIASDEVKLIIAALEAFASMLASQSGPGWKLVPMELLVRVMDQCEADFKAAHAEICKLQGLDPVMHDWPSWTTIANTKRWFDEIRANLLTPTTNLDEAMVEAGAQVLFALPGFRDPPSVARKIVTDILVAAREAKSTLKLHFTNDWLKSKIEQDGDDAP